MAGLSVPASWYDGKIAVRREGRAVWDSDGRLTLEADDGTAVTMLFEELRYSEARPGEEVYRRESEAEFRLILPADMPPGLAERLPKHEKYGRLIDKFGLGKATVALAAISAAAVAVTITAPDWLGPRVPATWEARIGEAMVGDLGNRTCSTPESEAVLAGLMAELDDGSPPIRVGIANIDMVNAVALPGGQVLLFDGLLQEAESPAEVAGVLAHEIGHVRERHVMTAIMRQFGLSILIGGAGSGVGETIGGIASLGYNRDAEREADEYARAQMADADISPLGAARFFERVEDESGGEANAALGWLATHPEPGERAEAFREAAKDGDYAPALSEEEFEALKSACANDPDVEEFGFF